MPASSVTHTLLKPRIKAALAELRNALFTSNLINERISSGGMIEWFQKPLIKKKKKKTQINVWTFYGRFNIEKIVNVSFNTCVCSGVSVCPWVSIRGSCWHCHQCQLSLFWATATLTRPAPFFWLAAAVAARPPIGCQGGGWLRMPMSGTHLLSPSLFPSL